MIALKDQVASASYLIEPMYFIQFATNSQIFINLDSKTQLSFQNIIQKNLSMQLNSDDFYGINRKLYKKSKQQPGFKSISDNIFLPSQPQFTAGNDAYETVHLPKQNILQQSLRKEVQSIIFAQTFINQIVYDCKQASPYTKDIDPSSYNLEMLPYYIPKSKQDNILVFESRFECGNLRRVIQKTEFEYNLILSTDFNTNGHTQWYFFSVANTRKNVDYRFNIINLLKPDSLYNVGMKPLIYSQKIANQKNIGWHREGNDICYYTTNLKRKNGGYYSSLTFTLRFQNDYDTVYIAHCYPYSYTQLNKYLKSIQNDPVKKNRFQRKFLCPTQSGNNCQYITIGQGSAKQKKAIILTARVHPGETMASYVIQYIIDFLLSNHPIAKSLRQNFVFRIVPMLNPDGVIVGNYRCNLSGADLNRQWIQPSKKNHPTIYFTKILIKKTKQQRQLGFCCDIHGHNRKKNTFIYGCASKDNSKKEQVFPVLMKNNCPVFSFKDCCFLVQKDREGAARIALWKQLNIINCFTLELSFCGSDFGKYEFYHFNITHAFCQSLEEYYDPTQNKFKKAMEQIDSISRTAKMEQNNKKDTQDSDYSGDQVQIENTKKSVDAKQIKGERDQTGQKNLLIKKKIPMSLNKNKKQGK